MSGWEESFPGGECVNGAVNDGEAGIEGARGGRILLASTRANIRVVHDRRRASLQGGALTIWILKRSPSDFWN